MSNSNVLETKSPALAGKVDVMRTGTPGALQYICQGGENWHISLDVFIYCSVGVRFLNFNLSI